MNRSLDYYRNNPEAFVREIQGESTDCPKQDESLRSDRNKARTAIRARNGCGKTALRALLARWLRRSHE